MRRLLSAAVLVATVALGAACGSDTPGTGDAATTAPGTPTITEATGATGTPPSPGGTGLPASAAQVCSEAKQILGETMGALGAELAKVGGGSDAAVQQAIDTMNEKFTTAGGRLNELANRDVPPEVKAAFTQAGNTLKEIASPAFTGTPQEIQQRLATMGATLQQLCG